MSGRRLILDQHLRVISWVAPRIGHSVEALVPGIGIGLEKNGELVAGVVYSHITPVNVDMHVASVGGRHWANREFLLTTFAYPFKQLGVQRITGFVRADNRDARRLDEHLGFVQEGVLRRAGSDGCDVIVYGMLREECRWVKP